MSPDSTPARLRLVASVLVALSAVGPALFLFVGLHWVAVVSTVTLGLILAGRVSLGRVEPRFSALLVGLGFDLASLSYAVAFGRDSMAHVGLLIPFVFSIPALSGAPTAVRWLSGLGRVAAVAAASVLIPREPLIDVGVPEGFIAVLRGGTLATTAFVLAMTMAVYQRLSAERVAALRAAATELERQNRLHAEVEQRLAAAMDGVDRSERFRRRFLNSVSHDLRTPLAMVRGLTEALQEEAATRGDEELMNDLAELITGERRLHEAVENLLEVARMERTEQRVGPAETVTVMEWLGDFLLVTERTALQRGLTVRVDEPSEPGLLVAREPTLDLVGKLLEDASRRARSEIVLSISAAQGRDHRAVRLTLHDDGPRPGATPAGTHRVELFLAERIARAHGGALRIDHAPDGTRSITVELPEPASRQQRVLVVDDMQVNGEVLVSRLTEMGAVADWEASGEAALAVMDTSPPYDLLLLDLEMPDMDGYEVARRLARLGARRPGRVIAVTAREDEESLRRCHEVGITERLLKPLSRSDLLDLLSVDAPTPAPSEELRGQVDASVLADLSSELDDAEFIRDMVRWFESSAKGRIVEGKDSLHGGDETTMRRAAHSLGGLASTVGARRLQRLARIIEAQSTEAPDALNAQWGEAETELGEVLDTLSRRWLSETAHA